MGTLILDTISDISNEGVTLTGSTSGWEAVESISATNSYVTCGQYPDKLVMHLGNTAKPAGSVIKQVRFGVKNRRADALYSPQYGVFLKLGDGGTAVSYLYPDSGGSSWVTEWAATYGSSTINYSDAQLNSLVVEVAGDRYFENPPTERFGWLSNVYVEVDVNQAPGTPIWSGPASPVTNTLTPTFSWQHVEYETWPLYQSKFQLKLFLGAQGDPGGATALHDSGVVNSSTTQSMPGWQLTDAVTYYAYIRTAHTTNGVDQWSGWSAAHSFLVDTDPGVPANVVPTQSAVLSTPYPYFDSTGGSGIATKRQWQIATDSGFSSNVQLLDEGIFRSVHFDSHPPYRSTAITPLAQGTHYVRARFVDINTLVGDWSTGTSFTVAHAPSAAVVAPTGGQSIGYEQYPELHWSFSDPYSSDSQYAYQVEMWKAGDKAGTEIDTGKTLSGNTFTTVGAVEFTWKDIETRWRVKVWDQEDVASSWSNEGSFFLRDVPIPNITYPTNGGTVSSATPTFSWTFSGSAGRTQAAYRVRVFYSGSTLITDSGTIWSSASTWTPPAPVLLGATAYTIQVDLTDNTGLLGSDTNSFTSVYNAPTPPTYSITTDLYTEQGKIFLDWSGSTVDVDNLGWRVYRRDVPHDWKMIYDGADAPTIKGYDDYAAPANADIEYAVVQVNDDGYGDLTESSYPVQSTSVDATDYFIAVPGNPTLNLRLDHVTSDDFGDEQEMGTFNVIGRGRRVEYGTRYGQMGSLTADFRDTSTMTARAQRLQLEAIRDSGLTTYLRTPFGDVWEVAMESAQISRVPGVGIRENASVTIAYIEITA